MDDDFLPDAVVLRRPGDHRAAVSNAAGRFEAERRQAVDDGWDSWADPDVAPLRTEVRLDSARSVISRNDSPDVPFDRSINPYRGCEHGCIYCFARPNHAYLGLSPGLDFETILFAKPDAPALLAAELARPSYRCAPIAIGTNTDPYQPIERERRIMRGVLEVLRDHRHPVTIVTKSALIERDLDILGPMAADGLAAVGISVTTLDRDLCRKLEPRASPPAARLRAISRLRGAGVPVAAMVAPIIPGLTDHELEAIVAAAAAAGAQAAAHILLRLPREVADLFAAWLEAEVPLRAARVLSLVRQTRGGALYQTEFGRRMVGDGPVAGLITQRMAKARRRFGLDLRPPLALRTDLFRHQPRQMELSFPGVGTQGTPQDS